MIEKSNSLHSIFQNKKIFVFDSEAILGIHGGGTEEMCKKRKIRRFER